MRNCLLVKHLPKSFNDNDATSLLKHYGATKVKCFSNSGKMKHCCFAEFENEEKATFALRYLHQLNIFGSCLVVVYAQSDFVDTIESKANLDSKTFYEDELNIFYTNIHQMSTKFNINYPIAPLLKYKYPDASTCIIRNIGKALMNVPKLYTQVLHLMNKMNLPPPFINSDYDFDENLLSKSFDCSKMELISESSESELDSSEQNNLKRKSNLIGNEKKNKKLKILIEKLIEKNKDNIEDINLFKKESSIKIKPILKIDTKKSKLDKIVNNTFFNKITSQKKAVENKNSEEENETENEIINFIDPKLLEKNKISDEEKNKCAAFSNYSIGDANCRIYIKNISKKVNEQDLQFIFGSFIDWKNVENRKMFHVNLFKKGKMNGQAFITFPNENLAALAIEKTNGYLLKEKPIVVCFAKSKRPKN